MSDPLQNRSGASVDISAEAMHKAEEFIEEEEGAQHKLKGWLAVL